MFMRLEGQLASQGLLQLSHKNFKRRQRKGREFFLGIPSKPQIYVVRKSDRIYTIGVLRTA